MAALEGSAGTALSSPPSSNPTAAEPETSVRGDRSRQRLRAVAAALLYARSVGTPTRRTRTCFGQDSPTETALHPSPGKSPSSLIAWAFQLQSSSGCSKSSVIQTRNGSFALARAQGAGRFLVLWPPRFQVTLAQTLPRLSH